MEIDDVNYLEKEHYKQMYEIVNATYDTLWNNHRGLLQNYNLSIERYWQLKTDYDMLVEEVARYKRMFYSNAGLSTGENSVEQSSLECVVQL